MNIHQRMKREFDLARTYARDGAFHTGAKILRDLSNEVKSHAEYCDDLLAKAIGADPLNLAGSGPTLIEPREG
ncbi:hypothetical protein [Mesorhizobium sp. J428]|uniref:hypothetical protein n=1 Tax=Mesorhizobium sp. J428 TaxID=2898440 RepID=UPI0021517334|nr:hypothetical protein [Mesorhizobium sp. J428]MCR5855967.1 hypothetical protein [Mesorhizobium sp. J428]